MSEVLKRHIDELTMDDIYQYHHDGIMVITGIFDDVELKALQDEADRVTEKAVAHKGENHLYLKKDDLGTEYFEYWEKDQSDTEVYHRSEKMWQRNKIWRAVTANPRLLEAMGKLTGHSFMPITDAFVCKLPYGNVPVPWHQDPPYSPNPSWISETTYEVPNIDADIYLDKSTIENGCVYAIKKHHLSGSVRYEDFDEETLFTKSGAVPMETEPGDVSFHPLSIPHGSRGNNTADIRRIFYIHYMNRSVFDQDYRNIEFIDKVGYNGKFENTGYEFVKQMVEDRKSLGWDLPESRNVSLDINGFRYNGNDKTPKRYWGKLINEISDDRIAYLKNLDVIDSERRPASEANKKIKHTQDELKKFISDLS